MHAELNDEQNSTRERIMQAASRLFSEKGFAGATTRAIAELANVNEVTLFRHFGSKENLAKSIMDQFGGQAIAADLESRFTYDLQKDLTLFGRVVLMAMCERSNEMRMAICESRHFPEFRQIVAENPRQLRHALSQYFQNQMKAGVMQHGNPEIQAQAFLGMFFSYVVLEDFLQDPFQPHLPAEEIIEGFVRIFLHGTQRNAE